MQSLDTLLRRGEGDPEDQYAVGEKQEMVEYLVLQRRYMKGIEGPWLVWGTVQETEASSVLPVVVKKAPVPIIDVV